MRDTAGPGCCGWEARWKGLAPIPSYPVTSSPPRLVCNRRVPTAPGEASGAPGRPWRASSSGCSPGQDTACSQNTACPKGHSPWPVRLGQGQGPSPGTRGAECKVPAARPRVPTRAARRGCCRCSEMQVWRRVDSMRGAGHRLLLGSMRISLSKWCSA